MVISMAKIRPRAGKIIAEELALFLSKRGLLAKMIREFKDASNIIAGAVEFLIGEGLARTFGVNLYFDEFPQGNYVLWNGSIDLKNLTFRHAPKGLPDLEVFLGDRKAMIEISFGIHPQTVISEIKEVLYHKPRSFQNGEIMRYLMVPNKIVEDLSTFIRSNVTVIPIEALLNTLMEDKRLSLEDFAKIFERTSIDTVDVESLAYSSILEAIWEETAKGRVIFGFSILRLLSELLNKYNFQDFKI